MSLSQDSGSAPMRTRWRDTWQNLQTISFAIGWAVGVPAGALAAIAWGLWTTQATYASMQRSYQEVLGQYAALQSRVDALNKVDESAAVERASMRDRILKLETTISPYIVTSDVIEKFGSHLGGIDGRLDDVGRNMAIEQRQRADQIAAICAKLIGIVGASGKKQIACP